MADNIKETENFRWEEPRDYAAFRSLTEQHRVTALFVHTDGCSVCRADQPRVEAILKQYPEVLPVIAAPENQPEITGQLLLFTAPMVLVFVEGKEVHRQGRFIRMDAFEDALRRWL